VPDVFLPDAIPVWVAAAAIAAAAGGLVLAASESGVPGYTAPAPAPVLRGETLCSPFSVYVLQKNLTLFSRVVFDLTKFRN
jgi:hypothetical protein